jgi:hypothetical protein
MDYGHTRKKYNETQDLEMDEWEEQLFSEGFYAKIFIQISPRQQQLFT